LNLCILMSTQTFQTLCNAGGLMKKVNTHFLIYPGAKATR
jgi:hypothetical protein